MKLEVFRMDAKFINTMRKLVKGKNKGYLAILDEKVSEKISKHEENKVRYFQCEICGLIFRYKLQAKLHVFEEHYSEVIYEILKNHNRKEFIGFYTKLYCKYLSNKDKLVSFEKYSETED